MGVKVAVVCYIKALHAFQGHMSLTNDFARTCGIQAAICAYLLRLLPLLPLLLPLNLPACTGFKVTHDGRTLVGNNEDAWSINAQVRFEQGRNGGYGAIYFAHFNGLPFRPMVDQLGMNEAGLVFDGFGVEDRYAAPVPGRKQVPFTELMPLVLRTCATVHEAAALLRTCDMSWLTHAMLFIVDSNGDHLIVEADTLMLGNDPSFAVGNWRMSTCPDPDAIPIPRLQKGRALLAAGADNSLVRGAEVLHSMVACRKRMGEGTLFSTLFDTKEGNVDLWFYHDFSQKVTFNLGDELAKGDRVIPMASLFAPTAEYAALEAYITPFHQRWLFWSLVGVLLLAAIVALVSMGALMYRAIARIRGRSITGAATWSLVLVFTSALVVIIPFLLLKEGVYYFGLGDATDPIHPVLKFLPLLLSLLLGLVGWRWVRCWKAQGSSVLVRWGSAFGTIALTGMVGLFLYWGMLW